LVLMLEILIFFRLARGDMNELTFL